MIGKLARVTHPISPDTTGEVVVHIRGGTETFMAISDSDLARNAEVLVVAHVSARTVQVTPFNGGLS